jgi:hypothetical protein
MKPAKFWTARLKPFAWYSALLFPFFWLVIGGCLRTPFLLGCGLLGIYRLRQERLLPRLRAYGSWLIPMAILTAMGLLRPYSESAVISPIWYILVLFYAVPAGILVARAADHSAAVLNWVCAFLMLGFGAWSYLVMGQIDLTEVVRITNAVATRVDQKYPAELFGIFSWDNVKMAIIPWCAYPLAAVGAVACRGTLLSRAIWVIAGGLGAYVAGAFLTRSVFLADAFAIGIVLSVLLLRADRKTLFTVTVTLLFLAGVLFEVVHSVGVVNESVTGLLDRFSYTSDDTRQYLWADAAKLIPSNPIGGGDALLEDHLWAHNLPLDMGLLYGIPGIVSITCLLGMLTASVVRWTFALRGSVEAFEVTFLSVFVAALVSCLISPPDLAFITPLVFIGVFARERTCMLPSRVYRRQAIRHSPLPAPHAVT